MANYPTCTGCPGLGMSPNVGPRLPWCSYCPMGPGGCASCCCFSCPQCSCCSPCCGCGSCCDVYPGLPYRTRRSVVKWREAPAKDFGVVVPGPCSCRGTFG